MENKYRLSFTSGALLLPETVTIAKRYLELHDWDALQSETLEGLLLRKTRASSRVRYFREIRARLMQAHPFELEYVAEDTNESCFVVFVICTRYYRLVGDFVRETLRDKIVMRDEALVFSDYFHFIEEKMKVHPELLELSETTRIKLRQVTFRMLNEGGLLQKGKNPRVTVPLLSEALVQKYLENNDVLALEHLLYRKNS